MYINLIGEKSKILTSLSKTIGQSNAEKFIQHITNNNIHVANGEELSVPYSNLNNVTRQNKIRNSIIVDKYVIKLKPFTFLSLLLAAKIVVDIIVFHNIDFKGIGVGMLAIKDNATIRLNEANGEVCIAKHLLYNPNYIKTFASGNDCNNAYECSYKIEGVCRLPKDNAIEVFNMLVEQGVLDFKYKNS